MIYLILPLNRKNSTIIASQNYDIKIWMLHTTTKRLEICVDITVDRNYQSRSLYVDIYF